MTMGCESEKVVWENLWLNVLSSRIWYGVWSRNCSWIFSDFHIAIVGYESISELSLNYKSRKERNGKSIFESKINRLMISDGRERERENAKKLINLHKSNSSWKQCMIAKTKLFSDNYCKVNWILDEVARQRMKKDFYLFNVRQYGDIAYFLVSTVYFCIQQYPYKKEFAIYCRLIMMFGDIETNIE